MGGASAGDKPHNISNGGDLKPGQLPVLRWDAPNVESSLHAVFTYVVDHADGAIEWYLRAKRPKKLATQWLRFGAIVATAVAGILPMISQVWGSQTLQPAWASVALGAAALLVGLDHFFGFSSGWMRFITTEHQIRQLLHAFQLDYDTERATWQGQTPNPEQVKSVLERCKAFLFQVDDLIRQETEQWVAEFQSAIKQIDEAARTRTEQAGQGGKGG